MALRSLSQALPVPPQLSMYLFPTVAQVGSIRPPGARVGSLALPSSLIQSNDGRVSAQTLASLTRSCVWLPLKVMIWWEELSCALTTVQQLLVMVSGTVPPSGATNENHRAWFVL